MTRIWKILHVFSWIFPAALLAIGYIAPPLRTPVTLTPPDATVLAALLIQIIPAVIWLIVEAMFASNRNTSTAALQIDVVWGIVVTTFLALWGGWLIAKGSFEYWFIVPFMVSMIDAMLTGWLGLNNASQKPLIGTMKE